MGDSRSTLTQAGARQHSLEGGAGNWAASARPYGSWYAAVGRVGCRALNENLLRVHIFFQNGFRTVCALPAGLSQKMVPCECFRLCGNMDAYSFHQRLPVVDSTRSPWYRYLRRVYRGEVPLPLDVKSLEVFYPGLLPIVRFSARIESCASSAPSCVDCAGWLSETTAVDTPHAYGAANGGKSVIWVLDGMAGNPFSAFLLLQRATWTRRFVGPNEWVEVIRRFVKRRGTGQGAHEGNGYGCWLWPTRGSGVWANVGTTARYRDRARALREEGHLTRDDGFGELGQETWLHICADAPRRRQHLRRRALH